MINQDFNFRLNRRMYNPIYWHIREAMNDPTIRYILLYGSSSAAKSFSFAQALVNETIERRTNTMIFRKWSTDIADSVFHDFTEVLSNYEECKDLPVKIITNKIFINGNTLRFRGLDRQTKIKGLSKYQRLFIDELTHFTREDWNELKRRLRGRPHQQILATWNPESALHWVKKELDNEDWEEMPLELKGIPGSKLDKEHTEKLTNKERDTILIKTTYRDNYWIVGHPDGGKFGFDDIHTKREFERMKKNNPDDYRVFGLGLWGVLSHRRIFKRVEIIDSIPEGAYQIPSGMDFGMSPSPTVLEDIYLKDDMIIFDERIYEHNLVNVKIPGSDYESIQGRLEEIEFSKKHIIIADSAEKKSILEIRLAGYTVYGVKKYPGSVKDGIRLMRSYRICITKRSKKTINDFTNYLYRKDQYGNIIPEPEAKNDHAPDCGCYVLLMRGLTWNKK